MSDVIEIMARALRPEAYNGGLPATEEIVWGDMHRTRATAEARLVLAALEENGLVVVAKARAETREDRVTERDYEQAVVETRHVMRKLGE